jgi:RimJ/RimL family protein N-acetyltransferase
MPWAATLPSADEMSAVLRAGEASFDADQEWTYTLVERDSGDVVGGAGLHPRSGPESIEIGYWVRSDRTGRGYATAAARALAEAAFVSLGHVERIEIRMDAANRASAAVPPKLGFHLVGAEGRDLLAPAHTGRGLVWALDRPAPGHG